MEKENKRELETQLTKRPAMATMATMAIMAAMARDSGRPLLVDYARGAAVPEVDVDASRIGLPGACNLVPLLTFI
ncbi:uncharacterized protein SPSK_10934 [Sporothrix schenckii 1099-18]|uniref:Uncharacterized protein n=1 Tax=Sporothrix schenckii 1099-18 TaxID=1397361 RepID=A0A0F2M9M1_SPOSC|nr:uncharacterized protein SPSK_10934 [Sporothrix schenckii 1099-18]KJR85495.1 hypothetical protein SPSK_10934 [Sporothrix schenckii 1099-18]